MVPGSHAWIAAQPAIWQRNGGGAESLRQAQAEPPPLLKIASAQFEHTSNDKLGNLAIISRLCASAAAKGARVVAFHECCICGFGFVSHMTEKDVFDSAEPIPHGPGTQALIQIAKLNRIAVLAGLFERDAQGKFYNTYICVDAWRGFVAKFRKFHPFISKYIQPGNEYCVFDLFGWKCGILTSYDNCVNEHVRMTALLGAEIIFMPHVTTDPPKTRLIYGPMNPALWFNRDEDPAALRAEFDGPKGRGWLMKWLPARAYDNAVYVVFSNAVGMDDGQVKPGLSMILDPFGDVLVECRGVEDGYALGDLTRQRLQSAGGNSYKATRNPELQRCVLGMQ